MKPDSRYAFDMHLLQAFPKAKLHEHKIPLSNHSLVLTALMLVALSYQLEIPFADGCNPGHTEINETCVSEGPGFHSIYSQCRLDCDVAFLITLFLESTVALPINHCREEKALGRTL